MLFRLNLGHIWETSGTSVTSVIFQFNFGHSKCVLKKNKGRGTAPVLDSYKLTYPLVDWVLHSSSGDMPGHGGVSRHDCLIQANAQLMSGCGTSIGRIRG